MRDACAEHVPIRNSALPPPELVPPQHPKPKPNPNQNTPTLTP